MMYVNIAMFYKLNKKMKICEIEKNSKIMKNKLHPNQKHLAFYDAIWHYFC